MDACFEAAGPRSCCLPISNEFHAILYYLGSRDVMNVSFLVLVAYGISWKVGFISSGDTCLYNLSLGDPILTPLSPYLSCSS